MGLVTNLRSPLALSGAICLMPMLLLTSGSVSTHALAVAGWQLRPTGGSDFWRGIFRELRRVSVGGGLAGSIVCFLALLAVPSAPVRLVGCVVLVCTIVP